MKKFMIIAPKNRTLYNFRGDLIKSILADGYDVVAIGPNKDNIEEVLKLGITFREVPLKKDKVSVFSDLDYYKKLKKVIKEEKPDIVFSYTIKPVIYGSLAAKSVGIKKIAAMITGLGRVFSSNTFKARILRNIIKPLYKRAFKACESVIFQNNDDLDLLVKQKYLSSTKAKVVHGSGVNMDKFKKTSLPKENIFLMVSRIIKEKGVIEYIKAAEMVKKVEPSARFLLVGGYDNSLGAIKPEDLKPYLEAKIIEMPGETEDIVPFYQQAKFFVLPTYYREGLPRTILEAMSVGRPIIATNWVGCKDAVENDKNGLLVNVRDPEDLASKMLYMINNPAKVEVYHKNCIDICKEKFDVNIINSQMKKIIGIDND